MTRSVRGPVPVSVALLVSGAAVGAAPARAETPGAAAALEEGDRLWAGRAEGAKGGTALEAPIEACLASYRRALSSDPTSLAARWRLMRALYFKGEYTTSDLERKKAIFDEGKRVGEDALAEIRRQASATAGRSLSDATPPQLVPFVKGRPDVLASFLWAAVDWGKWSLAFGKMAAVKQGAAGKIRDYCEAAISLDPAFDDAGGHRVLGRLHHQTPAVPFLTGWASREKALSNLRRAVELAPRHFINRLYLAEALYDYEKASRGEARAMLQALIADTPAAEWAVEDARAQEDARALLASWARP